MTWPPPVVAFQDLPRFRIISDPWTSPHNGETLMVDKLQFEGRDGWVYLRRRGFLASQRIRRLGGVSCWYAGYELLTNSAVRNRLGSDLSQLVEWIARELLRQNGIPNWSEDPAQVAMGTAARCVMAAQNSPATDTTAEDEAAAPSLTAAESSTVLFEHSDANTEDPDMPALQTDSDSDDE
ncbi:hypothetical protein PsYK624_172590 [Phanerochaete sordida]|uniref:Uncharacterized protein n=1 Tax=Phanerochaete sordida TaxID=48140 RepID=A0A9P3GZ25_9APHY|nr:hypothetical protein PsYK624_172590 [Phanerochaete sordida]